MQWIPLWSDLKSLLDSVFGRSTTIIAVLSPLTYLSFFPDTLFSSLRVAMFGALLVVIANLIYQLFVPSLQRSYPKFLDYELKILSLATSNALSIYEEFGQVTGERINLPIWRKSGLNFTFLEELKEVPKINDYKKKFYDYALNDELADTEDKESDSKKPVNNVGMNLNKLKLARSLASIKYVVYDSSTLLVRTVCTICLLSGVICIYGPHAVRAMRWIW